MIPSVLRIAGSGPSGRAGLQADFKVMSARATGPLAWTTAVAKSYAASAIEHADILSACTGPAGGPPQARLTPASRLEGGLCNMGLCCA